jgi:hypothetical protein
MKARMKGGERQTITSLQVRVKAGFGSCPRGSLANLIPLQESVRRLLTIVTCGPKPPQSFAHFARIGSSGKTCPVSSQARVDGSSEPFSGTWPKWGTARDGVCGELPMLELSTNGTDSSSWPTPRGSEAGADFAKLERSGTGLSLPTAVRLFPTPSANEDVAGLPTGKMQRMLGNHPDIRGSGSGTLNPRWVEWLMGFPDGHTALEDSETLSSRSKPTRSSRKSRASSE